MIELSIGQNVFHPTHGTGEIIGIKQMDVLEEFENYYVIKFLGKRLTSHIPVRNVENTGVRKVISKARVKNVFETLRQLPGKLPKHFKARKQKVEEMINTGRPVKIAEAVRELTWREQNDRLNKIDTKLLSQGREMLIKEIAVVTDSDVDEAQQRIDRALAKAIKAKETMVKQ